MKIEKLKANHFTKPVGNDLSELSLSWVARSKTAQTQKHARVEIALDPKFARLVFDSGERADIDSLSYCPDMKLERRTRYHWRVTVTANNGEKASAASFFETGKMGERMAGKWICADGEKERHYYLRKEFTLAQKPRSFRVYCAALGMFEIFVNGERATDEVLLPGYHSYTQLLHLQTFDLTSLVKCGKNVIALHVGPGWYGTRLGWDDMNEVGTVFGVNCELRESGNLVAKSDETWEWAKSPVTKSSIYYGEDYDATREMADWANLERDGAGWGKAKAFVPDKGTTGKVVDRLSPPIRVTETLTPELLHTPAGELVLDFGQEITGWFSAINRAKKGATWRMQFGEILQKGNFYRDNLRGAEAQYTYTSNGEVCEARPHFTFYGFRYVKLIGFPEDVSPSDFKALVIHSDIDRVGSIVTDNKKVNRFFLNTQWGHRGNFLDVPTDCPQRDERLGWTGDTQAFSGAACFHMDCSAFYFKFISDMIAEQKLLGGSVPHVVPDIMMWLKSKTNHGSAAWADAATIVPWTSYVRYGDLSLLRKEYPAMRMWVEYMIKEEQGKGWNRLRRGFHFADWLALDDHQDGNTCMGGTDHTYVGTAYYAHSADLAAKAAGLLGEKKDAVRYSKLAKDIRKVILREFFTPNGRCAIDTQTAHVIALDFDLVPTEFRKRLGDRLVEKIKNNDGALDTGFVGTIALCRVLSSIGRSDVAYSLLLREKYPSWLYEVNLGATTVWERWHSLLEDGTCPAAGMNSMNHYAYGSVADWMYRNMCGIQPVEARPGFRGAVIAPEFSAGFKRVKCSFDSPVGLWETSWRVVGKKVQFACTVPFNATAELRLPGMKPRTLAAGAYAFTVPLA